MDVRSLIKVFFEISIIFSSYSSKTKKMEFLEIAPNFRICQYLQLLFHKIFSFYVRVSTVQHNLNKIVFYFLIKNFGIRCKNIFIFDYFTYLFYCFCHNVLWGITHLNFVQIYWNMNTSLDNGIFKRHKLFKLFRRFMSKANNFKVLKIVKLWL